MQIYWLKSTKIEISSEYYVGEEQKVHKSIVGKILLLVAHGIMPATQMP